MTTHHSAAALAMQLIRERIERREFAPNSRLPRETELAAELGVSRNALREGIRALEIVGVLRSRHGSGTYVTALEPEDLLGGFAYSNALLDIRSAIDLAEFRRVTEPAACEFACDRATAEQKVRIRSLHEQMQQVTDPEEYARLDPEFHHEIVKASGNAVLIAVAGGLTNGPAWTSMWRAVTRDFVPERTRTEHENLVRAIETGDRELARATSNAHIAAAQAQIASVLGAMEPGTSRPSADTGAAVDPDVAAAPPT